MLAFAKHTKPLRNYIFLLQFSTFSLLLQALADSSKQLYPQVCYEIRQKKKLIQLIHIAKSQLGMEEELYRDVLESTTGKTSTKQMTLQQLEAVIDRFKALGFTVESKNKGL